MTRSYRPLAYADADTTSQMRSDCAACRSAMRRAANRTVQRLVDPAPSILFEDFPREIVKRNLTVTDAAARLANQLHLHLD
ncbi:MAG: hypothetical protein M3Z50_11880 [Actinomycetota bacterium]|nr:hypothetical protein [Actinomycetota bacterium]